MTPKFKVGQRVKVTTEAIQNDPDLEDVRYRAATVEGIDTYETVEPFYSILFDGDTFPSDLREDELEAAND